MNIAENQKNYYPNIKQSIFLNLRLILITVITLFPLLLIMMLYEGNSESQNPTIKSLVFLLGYTISFIIICRFAIKRIKHLDAPGFKLNITGLKPARVVILIMMTAALMIVSEPFSSFIPMPEYFKKLFAGLTHRNIFSFLTLVIAAPILEEVFFRGIILEGFLKNYSPTKAIIWSAIIFGLAHLNPWQAIPAAMSGVFIGWIYWKTKSLLPGIIIHLSHNLLGFLGSILFESDADSFIQLIDNIWAYIILFVISISILFWGYKILNKSFNTIKATQQ